MPHQDDPVLQHARREAILITIIWSAATLYCCLTCYFLGYNRGGHVLGPSDLGPVLGAPRWFFWGVLVPWGVCGALSLGFTGFVMIDDDLGEDHSAELEKDIIEEGERDHV